MQVVLEPLKQARKEVDKALLVLYRRSSVKRIKKLLGAVFLVAQLAVGVILAFTWQKRKQIFKDDLSVSISNGIVNASRTESLCKLYDSGYGRRF